MDVNVWMVIIGVGSIIANIAIAFYNAGKNKVVYDIKEILIDADKPEGRNITEARQLLSTGEYTILSFVPSLSNTSQRICLLAKIKK